MDSYDNSDDPDILDNQPTATTTIYRVNFLALQLLFLSFFLESCATYQHTRSDGQKAEGKTFVIVGASSGFGRGVAEQLGVYRANVVLAGSRTALLEEVARKIRKAGGNAVVVTIDISKSADVQRLSAVAVQNYDDIDVWMNMAGSGGIGRFWDVPIEEQARTVDINLKGFIYGSYAAIQQFRTQGYGRLINVGSVESVDPLAYHASYSAIKGGIISLGQALNQELRLSGDQDISVITVEPWAADASFWRDPGNHDEPLGDKIIMNKVPIKVVNAIIHASFHRKTELTVGWKAKEDTWLYDVENVSPANAISQSVYE